MKRTGSLVEYRTVFDASRTPLDWWFVLFPIGMLIAGTAALAANRFLKVVSWRSVGTWHFTIASVILVSYCALVYAVHSFPARELREGDVAIVEGTVRNFKAMPEGGHSTESFEIEGKRFEYGWGYAYPIFSAQRNKGYLYEGVYARITYSKRGILRVEVREGEKKN